MSAWRDPERWARIRSEAGCPICAGPLPADTVVVAELSAASLRTTDQVPVSGYCCLVARRHVVEFHELDDAEAAAFARDARSVSRALAELTGCIKLNAEIHGNTIPHLHQHFFPRYPGDPFEGGPIDLRRPDLVSPFAPGEHAAFVAALRERLANPLVSGGFAFRLFQEADRDAVIALWDACGLLRPWNDPHKDIARKLAVQRDLFLVGCDGADLVAAAMAGYDGHRGWVYYFAVAPTHRRRGLGRALMAQIETRLRALGCPKINIQVRGDNAQAIAFWERVGFGRDDTASLGKRLERDA